MRLLVIALLILTGFSMKSRITPAASVTGAGGLIKLFYNHSCAFKSLNG